MSVNEQDGAIGNQLDVTTVTKGLTTDDLLSKNDADKDGTQTENEWIVDERVQKEVFCKLDPVLRLLLAAVQTYQTTLDKEQATNNDILTLLQRQSESLNRLRQTIQLLRSNNVNDSESQWQVSRALAAMMDYLALPLLVILRATNHDWVVHNENTRKEALSQRLLLQSAQWKCVQQAAEISLDILRILTIASTKATKKEFIESKVAHSGLSIPMTVKMLLACATALPAGDEVAANLYHTNAHTESAGPSQRSMSRLDRGEDCCASLLQTITALLRANSSLVASNVVTAQTPDDLALAVAGALDGALIARIADTCVSIISPPSNSSHMSPVERHPQMRPDLLLQANECLQCLIRSVPIETVWQPAFPGCFAGLYRCLLSSLRLSSLSSQLPTDVLRTLCVLLGVTLGSQTSSTSSLDTNDEDADPLASLKSLVMQENKRHNTDSEQPIGFTRESEGHQEDDNFLAQVQSRVPSPLIILVRLLPSARTPSVRREAVTLFRTILVTTRECWIEQGSDSLSELFSVTLECCLELTSDADDDISKAAERALEDARSCTDEKEFIPTSRIIPLILELPSLARRRQDREMCSRLRLLLGCLSVSTLSKSARSTITSGSVFYDIREALVSVCDVAFEDIEYNVQSSALVIQKTACKPGGPCLRFFSHDSAPLMFKCLRMFGKALGPRHSALLVDTCIADLHDACLQRIESGVSLFGKSQVEWLHRWIGNLIIAREVIAGAFPDLSQPNETKSKQKQRKVLVSLVSAVLPLIVGRPLFYLPCMAIHRHEPLESFDADKSMDQDCLVSAARGNASVAYFLLDLVQLLFEVIGQEASVFLPTCIYPVLDKAGRHSFRLVQGMALYTISTLAIACQYGDARGMIADNMDIISGAMASRLRVPGGRSLLTTSLPDDNFLQVAAVAEGTFRALSLDNDSKEGIAQSVLSSGLQMVTSLLPYFDNYATALSDSSRAAMIFLGVFHSSLSFLQTAYRIGKGAAVGETNESEGSTMPWLQYLEPFRENFDSLSPEEGFKEYRDTSRKVKGSRRASCEVADHEAIVRQTKFVAQISSRCCYLLSHSNLQVQLKSCDTLNEVFGFLGWVSRNVPEKEDESNGPTTAILREVHSVWNAIATRLKALASVICVSRDGGSLLVVYTPSKRNSRVVEDKLGEKKLHLSKILSLVASMSECSGDFMASRLRGDIWACIGRIIEIFVRQPTRPSQCGPRALLDSSWTISNIQRSSDSDRKMLQSAVDLLARVYGNHELGLALSSLIPGTGMMLLPLLELGKSDRTGIASFNALRSMLRVDCDSLWRPLVELSGRPLPPHPLLLREDQGVRKILHETKISPLTEAALELLDFVDSLPEQALE